VARVAWRGRKVLRAGGLGGSCNQFSRRPGTAPSQRSMQQGSNARGML
jgi:hypothetical protein